MVEKYNKTEEIRETDPEAWEEEIFNSEDSK
jgi:hypothetical protein